jgi:hypothetical protein
MSTNSNKLVELKIAGRYRLIPIWATTFDFEVRPSPSFDKRAWKLWKPILFLMAKVAREEKITIKWVRIHSHFNLQGDIPHAMGWWDHEQKAMFLCHFDKETLLHELGHALSSGYHGDPWAKATARLYQKHLRGKELQRAMIHLGHYLAGRRMYKKIYGLRPAKYVDPPSMWLNLSPSGRK